MKNVLLFILSAFLLFSCTIFKCKKKDAVSGLGGSWELNYITGPRIVFDGLYPDKKPTINFNIKENQVSGNTSCNSFTGKLNVTGNKIDFTQPMAMTKMMCMDGQGEQVFMDALQKITSYEITDDGKTLSLISDDVTSMRFTKK